MLLNRDRALAVMDRHGLDALVATTPENVFYLSDHGPETSFHFRTLCSAILPRDENLPPTLIAMQYQLAYVAQRRTWMPQVLVQTGHRPAPPPADRLGAGDARLRGLFLDTLERGLPSKQRLLGRTLRELGLDKSRVGFDDVRVLLELRESEAPDMVGVDALNVFREIRLVKTADELALLRHAGRLLQNALEGVAAMITVGTTAREVLHYYRTAMSLQDGYGSHITGGGDDGPWLAYPDMSYRFKDGDVAMIDPAGHYRHYWADLGRSCYVGSPPARAVELFEVLRRCQDEVVPMIRPGVSSEAVKAAAVAAVGDDMPEGFIPLVHAIGLEQYDQPRPVGDTQAADLVFEDGMVINLETLYFELGLGILQIEDTYVIEGGGATKLSTLPPDPFVCGAR